MATLRIHILEGTRSNGEHVYACGTPDTGRIVPYVGRAMLHHVTPDTVTCLRCRKRYSLPISKGQP